MPVFLHLSGLGNGIQQVILLIGYTIYQTMDMGVTLYFERLRDWWDLQIWRSSDECREMIHARLIEHNEAMKNGTKSPYFN